MIFDYPISWLLWEIISIILTVLCMNRALKQKNYKHEIFKFLLFVLGAAIFENIGVLYVQMYHYDQRHLMMFGVVPLSVLLLEADILYVATILFEKLNLPKWASIWVIGFFCVFMDFSIDPVFINDSYLLNGAMSGQWNWTWYYSSNYYGIPYTNFSGWIYMTGLYPAFMYFLQWLSDRFKKPKLKYISPFIASIFLMGPIAICSPFMQSSTETGELLKLILNCIAALILLFIFRKRKKTSISFKDEPLLVIVPACIYVYLLGVVAIRGMWSCLPPVLICMAIHAVYYFYLFRHNDQRESKSLSVND